MNEYLEEKAEDRIINLLTTNSKYKDISKVTVEATPKGNWRVYYDGKDTGMTIDRKQISDRDVDKLGLEHHSLEESNNVDKMIGYLKGKYSSIAEVKKCPEFKKMSEVNQEYIIDELKADGWK